MSKATIRLRFMVVIVWQLEWKVNTNSILAIYLQMWFRVLLYSLHVVV